MRYTRGHKAPSPIQPHFPVSEDVEHFGMAFDTQSVKSIDPFQKELTETMHRIPHSRAFVFSLGFHVVAPVAVAALFLVCLLLGINLLDVFSTPVVVKPQPLEFVLVPPTQVPQKPLNPHTHYRATKNSRASGPHQAGKVITLQKSRHVPKVVHVDTPRKTFIAHAAPVVPVVKPAKANPVLKQPVASKVPHATAPPAVDVTENSSENNHVKDAASVDALQDSDFAPYMKDLQRRIRQSWIPPRGNESKRVVVMFEVNQDGRLSDVKITQSSGVTVADDAAIKAVEQVFPFRPLPAAYPEKNIDIEFTFDYNVFQDKERSGSQSTITPNTTNG